MKKDIEHLLHKAQEMRKLMLETCINSGTGHVSSSLSCMDILVTLYYGHIMKFDPQNPEWDQRDYFILSKGQASPALYAILGDLGFYSIDELKKFALKDGIFGVHLQKSVPGVEITAGSLGHGFGIAAGIAQGVRMNRSLNMVFALLGDGECYEGSIWETALYVSHQRLNNLVTIIDRNYLCVTDFTENLLALEPMDEKWRAFGFEVVRIDGHSIEQLLSTLETIRSRRVTKPLVIIADTVKGKGVKSMSDLPICHGVPPQGEAAVLALEELTRSYHNG